MTYRETAQLFFAPGIDVAATSAAIAEVLLPLPGLAHQHLGTNLEGSWGAGTFTLDLHWGDAGLHDAVSAAIARLPGFLRAEHVAYAPLYTGRRMPELSNGIWRTLMLRVRDNASEQHVEAFEHDLLRMPKYMPGIRNWRLGRVTATHGRWTHVWQQEFARVEDLLGEYMLHPYHWGWVDPWFDSEFPECLVDAAISHAFCPLPASLLCRDD